MSKHEFKRPGRSYRRALNEEDAHQARLILKGKIKAERKSLSLFRRFVNWIGKHQSANEKALKLLDFQIKYKKFHEVKNNSEELRKYISEQQKSKFEKFVDKVLS